MFPDMRIGDLARQIGVRATTIRFYEREGLMLAPERSAAGYREYGPSDKVVLAFIMRARELDLTLDEIRKLPETRRRGDSPCAEARAALRARMQEVDERLRELEGTRARLAAAILNAHSVLDETCDGNRVCDLIC